MNQKNIDEQLLDFAETLLNNKNMLSLSMKGYSMFPTLRAGDVGTVTKCSVDDIRIGDIVVFREDNKLIAHRLVKIKQNNGNTLYITKGDKNSYYDQPFTKDQFAGKLENIQRGKKTLTEKSPIMNYRKFMALRFTKIDSKINQRLASTDIFIKNALLKFKSIRSNFRLIAENSKKEILSNSLITILQGIMPFVIIVCIKLLVDLISGSTTHSDSNRIQFWILLSVTALIFLLNGILSEIRGFFSEKLTQSVTKNIYNKLHETHLKLDLSHYENAKEQNAMHRAVQEATYRPVKIIGDYLTLIRSIAAGLFLISIFVSIKWYLVLILMISTIPGILHKVNFARKVYQLKISQSATEREMYYYNRVLTAFPFAKEIRLFDFSAFFMTRFKKVQQKIFAEKLGLSKSELRIGVLSQIFAVSLIFLSLAYVSYMSYVGSISTGTVVLFFFAFQRGYSVLNDLFSSITQMVEDNTFLNDFISFLL